ncbi:(-)-kolavenyl diphosphate synthase TPS28, chloroplastic [Linum perenne]
MKLESMEDGEISLSAYDTAWVAMVRDVNGSSDLPQFPESIEWIANNQLLDGSWGDNLLFQTHDRILNTLACIIALTSWNLHPDKCLQGLKFFNENLSKLEEENTEHMPIGFEVIFPSLLDLARHLNIDVPHDSPIFQHIKAAKDIKLKKIPWEVLHTLPTSLLYSLEGMEGLDWERLMKLQNQNGSFLFSTASTAYAFSQTNDPNCLAFLTHIVNKFQGGVPSGYPVDLFENIWVIDRLQRLGISRYFQPQIKKCVDYIEKFWDEKGICWARNSEVRDIDDTAMGFRILRLHGRQVSPDVFKSFEKNGEFFCFVGESSRAVTGLFNLYRASQVLFPGEEILGRAREYAYNFLNEKKASNELLDKWIITKDLPREVGYALDIPFYASLPRVESRFFIDQYGGADDVWIGKILYRMPMVNNKEYLELAKIDYNNCQQCIGLRYINIYRWHKECGLEEFGVSKRSLLLGYYVAAATVFEQDRSDERMAWAKTTVLMEAIQSYFHVNSNSKEQRAAFVHDFTHGVRSSDVVNGWYSIIKFVHRKRSSGKKSQQELVKLVLDTLNYISLDTLIAHDRDIVHTLHFSWEEWLVKWEEEGDRSIGEAELVVKTMILTTSEEYSSAISDHPLYSELSNLTNEICHQLAHFRNTKGRDDENNGSRRTTSPEIEAGMQQLLHLVTLNSDDEFQFMKQMFLDVAKTFYYLAVCDIKTINHHLVKVLFERVY